MEHTQGKWEVERLVECPQDYDSHVRIASSPESETNGGFLIARTYGPDRQANARFIAAAPKLLTALKALYNDCRNTYMDEQRGKAMQQACDAIASAE